MPSKKYNKLWGLFALVSEGSWGSRIIKCQISLHDNMTTWGNAEVSKDVTYVSEIFVNSKLVSFRLVKLSMYFACRSQPVSLSAWMPVLGPRNSQGFLGNSELLKSPSLSWKGEAEVRRGDATTIQPIRNVTRHTDWWLTHIFTHTFHTRFIFTWWVLMYWCIDVWLCWVVDHFWYCFKLEAYVIATGFLSLPSLFSSHRVGRLGILRQSQETVVNDLLQWDDSETPNGVQLSFWWFWWWDCWITPVCHGKPSESGTMSKRVINVAKCMVDLRSHHGQIPACGAWKWGQRGQGNFLLASKMDSFRFHACGVMRLCSYAGCW